MGGLAMTQRDILQVIVDALFDAYPDITIDSIALDAVLDMADAIIAAQSEPEPVIKPQPVPALDAIPGWEAA